MKKTLIAGGAALIVSAGLVLYQGSRPAGPAAAPPAEGAPIVEITLPASLSGDARLGKTAFDATCAACHGENATGRMGFGPPLVHPIYEPNHHGDMAFEMAVRNGVRAHHWKFGDMPPQDGLTRAEVAGIVSYVRALQRANGIN